jgi:type IV pilus assembly protein PilX
MRRTSSLGYRIARRQTGAALVIGLLLLLVLTVLAVSGVNSTSLNLLMVGNEQYSQNAFQAAESGIERAIAGNQFNPDPSLAPERQENVELIPNGVSKYTAVTMPQLMGVSQPALPGSSLDSFSTYHFEINSTGTSKRGAIARNVQAIAVIAPADSTVSPVPTAPGSAGAPMSDVLE